MKFRKKPVVIDAIQFTGHASVYEMVVAWGEIFRTSHGFTGTEMEIDTLEGTHKAQENDWIIKGVKGEFYPCKADIFALTYEALDGSEK